MGRHRRVWWMATAALLLLASLGACGPSQEELDAERSRVRQLQGDLIEARRDRDGVQERLTALQAENGSLASRLEALGADLTATGTELEQTRRALEELRARERQAQARLQTFRQMLERFRAMIAAGRLRVRIVRNRMVVELPEGVLFDSGKADLKPEGQQTLTEVAGVLREIADRSFQVAGHTDNVPIRRSQRFPSNWELSTARAVNVARFVIDQGVPPERLSAAGYADTLPVTTNDTDEGRAQNRRIEIALVPNLDELPDLSSLEGMTNDSPPAN